MLSTVISLVMFVFDNSPLGGMFWFDRLPLGGMFKSEEEWGGFLTKGGGVGVPSRIALVLSKGANCG